MDEDKGGTRGSAWVSAVLSPATSPAPQPSSPAKDSKDSIASAKRQMLSIEVKPGETMIVSWKKLLKEAGKGSGARLDSSRADPVGGSVAAGLAATAVHAQYSFGPLIVCLFINYLDRFLSAHELLKGKAWMTQLISQACLSLAAKMEEAEVPLILDLQAKYVFEAKTIQRMELIVLGTLNWRMQAVTPIAFLDYSLNKFSNGDFQMMPLVSRSTELILNSIHSSSFFLC